MARITVEDCLENIDNRFNLVVIASKIARQLSSGIRKPLVNVGAHKYTTVALIEIASGLVTPEGDIKSTANDETEVIAEGEASVESTS